MKCKECSIEIIGRTRLYCEAKCRRRAQTRRYREKHPGRVAECRARDKFNNRVSYYNLRPEICSLCREKPDNSVHGHHEDYNQPFKVVWVCRKCHSKIHNQGIERLKSEVIEARFNKCKHVDCERKGAYPQGYCMEHWREAWKEEKSSPSP